MPLFSYGRGNGLTPEVASFAQKHGLTLTAQALDGSASWWAFLGQLRLPHEDFQHMDCMVITTFIFIFK
jgi:hypothetical protein